jgi:signal transduction histidine kinase
VVDGHLWGVVIASSAAEQPLPASTESRIADFTELAATAISNTQAWAETRALADEQAALRRVATLAAQGVLSDTLFAVVTEEVGRLLGTDLAALLRAEAGDAVAPVATWSAAGHHPDVAGRWPLGGDDVATTIARTGRPARIDDWSGARGRIAEIARDQLGACSSVGSPIVVEGRLWGMLLVHSTRARELPPASEKRLTNFTELVATAISNAESRTALTASRARLVAAADEERRRVVHDLHDGAQQRLVHTVVTLKLARRALDHQQDVSPLVTEALDQAQHATAELRELSHGILPAVLTHGGLREAVNALATRAHVAVENAVTVDRLAAPVEATAYFVVAEALTNVTKHAHAEHAVVAAHVEDGTLHVEVRDDGVGGAQVAGSGLTGLADRLAVLDGDLRVATPPGGGTVVTAVIPLTD